MVLSLDRKATGTRECETCYGKLLPLVLRCLRGGWDYFFDFSLGLVGHMSLIA